MTTVTKKYAIRHKERNEWAIHNQGARLDPFGSIIERAEFMSLENAILWRQRLQCQKYTVIIEFDSDYKDMNDFKILDV